MTTDETRHADVLRALKERMPDYMGNAPKAQHYQGIHAALDAAIAALTAPDDEAIAVCPKNDDKLWTEAEDLAACERAIDRMGWPELRAFFGQPGQSPSEDAGGSLLRRIKTLFGITPEPVESYRAAMRRMVDEAKASLPPAPEAGQ